MSEDPHQQMKCLSYELEQYLPGLSKRPFGIIANKMDLKSSRDNFEKFAKQYQDQKLIDISAKHYDNIDSLLYFIRQMCTSDQI